MIDKIISAYNEDMDGCWGGGYEFEDFESLFNFEKKETIMNKNMKGLLVFHIDVDSLDDESKVINEFKNKNETLLNKIRDNDIECLFIARHVLDVGTLGVKLEYLSFE